ncbi:MAG TPA: SHOCT domain-containing protein [Jatrophihabitans sp.]|jgi:hypothetical protein
MPRRFGRPGLIGTMARTAVVAGTATAVSGRMQRRAAANDAQAAQQEQAGVESQAELDSMQRQTDRAQAGAGGGDLTAELDKLASLKASGALTDQEFSAAKAKLLN